MISQRQKYLIVFLAGAGLTVFLTWFGSVCIYKYVSLVENSSKISDITTELTYYKEAEEINDYYARFNINTRVDVVRKTLMAIDTLLPKYFPKGPYTRKDLLAMAMVESSFNQYLVGRHKEYGIFQILPESCAWMGITKNQFDVDVNTELALFVLKEKFKKHKNYKMGIIAYNGVVIRKGILNESYWDKFIKYRRALDDIIPDKTR